MRIYTNISLCAIDKKHEFYKLILKHKNTYQFYRLIRVADEFRKKHGLSTVHINKSQSTSNQSGWFKGFLNWIVGSKQEDYTKKRK